MKIKNPKHAFTLVEVIVSSVILTIALFGIFRLIGENNKSLFLYKEKSTLEEVKKITETCIENKYTTLSEATEYFLENDCVFSTISGSALIYNNTEYSIDIDMEKDYENYQVWSYEIKSDYLPVVEVKNKIISKN